MHIKLGKNKLKWDFHQFWHPCRQIYPAGISGAKIA